MTKDQDTTSELDRMKHHVRCAIRELSRAVADCGSGIEGHVEDPLTPPSNVLASHIRAHRPGRPAKLDADPELRDFVLARLDHMTFPQIEAEVAAAFPPERQVRKSAIHKWWVQNRKR